MSDKCPKCGLPKCAHSGDYCLRRQLAAEKERATKAEAACESLGRFVIDYTASLQDSAYDMINSPADREAIADCLVEWLGGIVAQTRRFIAATAVKEAT